MDTRTVTSVADVDRNQWNTMVSQARGGSVFHRTGWLGAVENALEYAPRHVLVERNKNPVGVLPGFVGGLEIPDRLDELRPVSFLKRHLGAARLTSIRPGFGGPAVVGDEREVLETIFDTVPDTCAGSVVVHRIRTFDRVHGEYGKFLTGTGYLPSVLTCVPVVRLDCGWDLVRDRIDGERIRNVRQARKRGVDVVERPLSTEAMDEFYSEYRRVIERVGERPLPPTFHHQLLERMPERLVLFAAEREQETVGMLLCLVDEERSSLHAMFSGVRDAYFEYYSTFILHFEAMKWATEAGYDLYNFGESGAHFDNGGLAFKRQYGAEAVPVVTWERGQSRVAWPVYRSTRRLIRRYGDVLGEG